MKRSFNKSNFKTFGRYTAVAIMSVILFTSCKKDSTTSDSISDDEVAAAVNESVSALSGGMVTQTESSASLASTSNLACGASSDTTITGQNAAGAVITYNYSLNFNRSLVCQAGIPSQFNANFTGSSSYSAVTMSSDDKSNGQIMVTGLPPVNTAFTINENYARNGTQQSKVRLQRSFQSTITITSSNIKVDKTTLKITSGIATVNFSGSGSGGYTTSRGGTITFLGNSQATLALQNGNSYSIQW